MAMSPSFTDWDSGARASDVINEKIAHQGWWEIKNQWMAFKLEDGSSDGVLYDKRLDAVRHQRFEAQCVYICFRGLGPNGSSHRDMAIMIMFAKAAYKAGFRMTDPDAPNGGQDAVMTTAQHDYQKDILPLNRIEQKTWDAIRAGFEQLR